MPRVIFVHPDNSREVHDVRSGDTIMDCALDNRVAGIEAKCHGGANCSTCHCYIEPPWQELLPACTVDEQELLSFVWQRRGSSRLACQLIMREQLDGIYVHIPEKQT